MVYDNKYEGINGQPAELTGKEIVWFYGIITKFHELEEASGLIILNRNHNCPEMPKKSRKALGVFYTYYPNDSAAKCMITIDNGFIHACYQQTFSKKHNLYFDTLESVLAHEIAHRYQFRHCKRHTRLAKEILQKYALLE